MPSAVIITLLKKEAPACSKGAVHSLGISNDLSAESRVGDVWVYTTRPWPVSFPLSIGDKGHKHQGNPPALVTVVLPGRGGGGEMVTSPWRALFQPTCSAPQAPSGGAPAPEAGSDPGLRLGTARASRMPACGSQTSQFASNLRAFTPTAPSITFSVQLLSEK